MSPYFEKSYELISKAYEKELGDRFWKQWLVNCRLIDKGTFIGFEEYKNRSRVSAIKVDEKLTKEQIEDKVKGIIELTLQKGG